MSEFFLGVFILLLVTVMGVLGRLLRAATPVDCGVCASLVGALLVALVLLLAEVAEMPALRDVALVLAVLGAVGVSSFASRPEVARERAR